MNVFSSFLTGLFFTALLFAFCIIIVVGIKAVYNFIICILPERKKLEPIEKEQSPKEQPPKKSRSIEINADEIDKIFFKKSS